MKKPIMIMTIFLGIISLTCGLIFAQTKDVTSTLASLKDELLKKGLAATDLSTVNSPLKDMLTKGAAKEDLKTILLNLASNGLSGSNFSGVVNTVRDFINTGESSKVASNLVSQAIQKAKALGLKGPDLAIQIKEKLTQFIQTAQKLKQNTQQGIGSLLGGLKSQATK